MNDTASVPQVWLAQVPGVHVVRDAHLVGQGLLYPHPQAIAAHLRTLCRDTGLRARMGAAARRFVERKYEIAGICSQLAAIYRGAAAR